MTPFDSVLVANRGEIAVRVMRSARALGYRSVAVYSAADTGALHTRVADQALYIGPSPPRESYLHIERVVDAARRAGAGAIHPGYGFLSENADFARACAAAGIVFVGPSPQAIELMGNKAAAKARMLAAGVPCIPGYQGEKQSDAALLAEAARIGVPLMVKAAAGGGGRGMRLVRDMSELPSALAAARSEAGGAFGSDQLILERAISGARHVEVQIVGDQHGHYLHLGERDCSVQRRHQKVIEEAPCPVMSAALREAMGAAAVTAARSIDYCGAGTVEFLLDVDGNFYFLEMNTRLQVEHPVTEMVTGVDLVELQLRIARGETLPFTQDQLVIEGHALEARLYAETVYEGFLPAAGTVHAWMPPRGSGVRVDHGLLPGQVVTPDYDPMLAKVIARGRDRDEARRRLLRALGDTVLLGIPNNRQFLIELLERPAFVRGSATTDFIGEQFPDGPEAPQPGGLVLCCAALLQTLRAAARSQAARASNDAALEGFSGSRLISATVAYSVAGQLQLLAVRRAGRDDFLVTCGDAAHALTLLDDDGSTARIVADGRQHRIAYTHAAPGSVELVLDGSAFVLVNQLASGTAQRAGAGSGAVLAPMHGNLLALLVSAGDRVRRGDALAVIEAMKMEHRLQADVDGVVSCVLAAEGEQVAAGALLMEIGTGAQ